MTQSCADIKTIMIVRARSRLRRRITRNKETTRIRLFVQIKHKPKNMKNEHDGKKGCGAKRFSGAHSLRRAFHVRLDRQFLSDFKRRFAPVCVAIARVVFESTVQGVCLSAGAQRRHLYQDKHTPCNHDPMSIQEKQRCSQYTSTRPTDTIQGEAKIIRHLPVENSIFFGMTTMSVDGTPFYR